MNCENKEFIILSDAKKLAINIILFVKKVKKINEYEIASQLLRSGTSIGAQLYESLGSITRPDLIHKLNLAHKESLETTYWLELLSESILAEKLKSEELIVLKQDTMSITKRLAKSIKTLKSRIN